jgi:arylsulfatase A-like enzyme
MLSIERLIQGALLCFLCRISWARPNIVIILADDLGFGDLGWEPFFSNEMKHVSTPNLRKMSKNGMTLHNFHVASPVCSPSRASILVGLFPWRMGIDFIMAGDLKNDGSEEMDHEQLPMIPNIAMSFHKAGYFTAHIGKWHLGGQSHVDIPNRVAGNCSVPGINQYGFDEYVGMSEGTGSARYITHQAGQTYHQGSNHLVRNDIPLPPPIEPEILTDRQASEAIRVIRSQVAAQKPFFVNLWFDAPHRY